MLTRRLQVLLDEEHYRRLAMEAEQRRVSVASLVREAIDLRFGASRARRARALRDFLDAADVEVPSDPAELKRELAEERAGSP